MKEKFETLKRRYTILDSEVENIFYFVSDFLNVVANETKIKEPYAVKAIDDLTNAANVVFNLIDYIEEDETEETQPIVKTYEVSKEIIDDILDNQSGVETYGEPHKLLWYYDEEFNKYVGCDNLYGHAWIEEFDTKEECVNWLLGE